MITKQGKKYNTFNTGYIKSRNIDFLRITQQTKKSFYHGLITIMASFKAVSETDNL